MDNNSISKEKIDNVVKAILQIPSPENSQPWRLVVKKNTIEVFHSYKRSKLANYPDDLSVMGLGMIAESIDIECSANGLSAKTSIFLENRSDEKPWLIAELETTDTKLDHLAKGIMLRHTDRRRYIGGSLNDPIFKKVKQEASANSGANVYFTNKYPDNYLDLMKKADEIVMSWQELRKDLIGWTRFTEKQINETKDGMTWRSFLRGPENFIYYLRSRIWWFAAKFDWFPEKLQKMEVNMFDDSSELSPLSYEDGAGIGCITTASDSAEDLVQSGRLALRIWLLFNIEGYGFQPLSNLSSTVYALHLGKFNPPDNLASLMDNSYETFKELFGFSDKEIPIFSFRAGRPIGEYPKKARSVRNYDFVTYES